ncbi:hypothetical protein [Phreatobacter sp.]|uniref:hypothetical protein n=1 Tax=Phreatobacter sp. TaxID=1966341 RepID=UPI0025CE2F5A|nr:hypothetical protein [Phreatobacter sp.]
MALSRTARGEVSAFFDSQLDWINANLDRKDIAIVRDLLKRPDAPDLSEKSMAVAFHRWLKKRRWGAKSVRAQVARGDLVQISADGRSDAKTQNPVPVDRVDPCSASSQASALQSAVARDDGAQPLRELPPSDVLVAPINSRKRMEKSDPTADDLPIGARGRSRSTFRQEGPTKAELDI